MRVTEIDPFNIDHTYDPIKATIIKNVIDFNEFEATKTTLKYSKKIFKAFAGNIEELNLYLSQLSRDFGIIVLSETF